MADGQVPVSISNINDLVHTIIDQHGRNDDPLGTFVDDTLEVVGQFATNNGTFPRRLAASYRRRYSYTSEIIGSKSFGAWTETQRGREFRDVAPLIADHARNQATKIDLETETWVNHPAISALASSEYVSQVFTDSNLPESASIGFIIFLLCVIIALLILCLVFC